jgi:hypothetical protein
MGLTDKAPPRLENDVLTTWWLGDTAVDADASDVDLWCFSGDKKYLEAKPGEAPAEIKFRGLTSRELRMLPKPPQGEMVHPLYFVQAARFGVLSVGGIPVRRIDVGGVMALSDETIDQLDSITAEIPLAQAMGAISQEQPTGEESATCVDVSLAEWLGIHVVARTFRVRGKGI